jgi:2-polyprenyl-3-methyl-5-hydroxy-6-metoxy-1,4-benzoquinol methylase
MSYTPQVTSPLEELKAKQHQVWSNGDYGKIAWITVPLAETLCDAVDLRPGSTVLDVACGTGHVAIEAARTFCEVSAVDYVEDLVETARRRAAAEGLSIAFDAAEGIAADPMGSRGGRPRPAGAERLEPQVHHPRGHPAVRVT